MSITFGSVGDIIAVGQIAWSLVQALTDSAGSAKEYQGLIKELRAFEQAVLQIVVLWQNYNSPNVVTTDIVKDWQDTLGAFREKVNGKYGTGLSASGSGNWAKDASKKLLWMKEKEDILELRRKLSLASDMITMLTLEAMGKSNKLAEDEIKFRVQVVHSMLEGAKKRAEEQTAQLTAIDRRIEVQSKASDLILSNVKGGITTLIQIQSMMADFKNVLCLLQSHMSSQKSMPRGLGTSWQHDPVTLEDALGFRIPIPLETVTSWKILDLILRERFKKRPGYRKVLQGEFAIEEGVTGRDIRRDREFTMCFRPGQKIDMSMIFSDVDTRSNHCPRCNTKSEAEAEARTKCNSCEMWFQRLIEVDDNSNSDEGSVEESLKSLPTSSKIDSVKKDKSIVSTPADFQRVRLMSMQRLKEQTDGDKSPELLKFKDALGRKFSFPFHLCSSWAGMEELIRQAFLNVDVIGIHVADGHYDLLSSNGEIILPQVWDTVVRPGWSISMVMWPMPNAQMEMADRDTREAADESPATEDHKLTEKNTVWEKETKEKQYHLEKRIVVEKLEWEIKVEKEKQYYFEKQIAAGTLAWQTKAKREKSAAIAEMKEDAKKQIEADYKEATRKVLEDEEKAHTLAEIKRLTENSLADQKKLRDEVEAENEKLKEEAAAVLAKGKEDGKTKLRADHNMAKRQGAGE